MCDEHSTFNSFITADPSFFDWARACSSSLTACMQAWSATHVLATSHQWCIPSLALCVALGARMRKQSNTHAILCCTKRLPPAATPIQIIHHSPCVWGLASSTR